MKLVPYEHQIKAMNKALKRLRKDKFFALYMEMGTGKSKVALDLIDYLDVKKIIIFAPKGIIQNTWRQEVEKNTDIKYFVFDNPAKLKINNDEPVIILVRSEYLSTRIDKIKWMKENLIKDEDTLVIIDEASIFRYPRTNRSVWMMQMFTESNYYKLILSGTPFTQNVAELWSQFEILQNAYWGQDYEKFLTETTFSPPGKNYRRESIPEKVIEVADFIKDDCFKINKNECLDLPERIYKIIKFNLEGGEAESYQSMHDELMMMIDSVMYKAEHALELFTRLRTLTSGIFSKEIVHKNPKKLEILKGVLEEMDGKVMIYASYIAECKMIADQYPDISVCNWGKKKGNEVERFRLDSTKKLFISTPDSGAYGFNMQFCSNQIFYDRPLSLEKYLQAQGRIHRNGQLNKCLYVDLVAEGTVDEAMLYIHQEKISIMRLFHDKLKLKQVMEHAKGGK